MSTFFTLAESGGIAELTLSRPETLNAMSAAFWTELPDAIRALDARGATRVLILAASGKHFTAGMDLSVFAEGMLQTQSARWREQLKQQALRLQDAFNAIERARFPAIAAIQGGCIGGGVDMACACDLRYATRDAFFCIQEINIGMMADLGTLQRMPKLLSDAVVRELAYTGDRLSAQEAHRLGFVNHLFDTHESLLLGARATAERIASKSPLAVAGSKEAITFARDHAIATSLAMAASWQSGMLDTDEMARQIAAMKEKRDADFEPLAPLPAKM